MFGYIYQHFRLRQICRFGIIWRQKPTLTSNRQTEDWRLDIRQKIGLKSVNKSFTRQHLAENPFEISGPTVDFFIPDQTLATNQRLNNWKLNVQPIIGRPIFFVRQFGGGTHWLVVEDLTIATPTLPRPSSTFRSTRQNLHTALTHRERIAIENRTSHRVTAEFRVRSTTIV